jgi:enterochelin esterase-like enzyme
MNFLQKTAARLLGKPARPHPLVEQIHFHSSALQRVVLCDVYLPVGYRPGMSAGYPLVLFNDGQDLPRMDFETQFHALMAAKKIPPMVAVGMHANERRIREYGTARQADYKGRGDLAAAHAQFVVNELLPHLHSQFRLSSRKEKNILAGFSLGGLSAFDIAWAHPHIFGAAGVFSGSLWWRSADVRPEDPDADRIMHDIVAQTRQPDPSQSFWFQCGTLDETDDRNHNGVIDAIDDTLDLIRALREKGIPEKNLRYLEMEGGRHEPATWAQAMPDFLNWVL